MFAIIDVETTGGQPPNDRITEIAIVRYDGATRLDEYSTLVNPERSIPPFVSRLTGISNEMVAGAPRFYEVAREIVERTEGCVFVGHNVRFDYAFVKAAFQELGYTYTRKTLCTLRLAKKLLPGQKSYSLGKLAPALGIKNNARHRALGDAQATLELLRHLQSVNDEATNGTSIEGLIQSEVRRATLPPLLSTDVVEALPAATGVYYLHDKDGRVLYVGKSVNIRQRVMSHLRLEPRRKREMSFKQQIADISWEVTGSELIALLLESREIKRIRPPYNKALLDGRSRAGLYLAQDERGYNRLELRPYAYTSRQQPLMLFSSQRKARRFLEHRVQEARLCPKLTSLERGRGPCFEFQIHRHCYGACVGEEPPEAYNARLEALLQGVRYPHSSFVLLGPGRSPEELSAVLVEDSRYRGFGYVAREAAVHDLSELQFWLKPDSNTRDAQAIVRGFVHGGYGQPYRLVKL